MDVLSANLIIFKEDPSSDICLREIFNMLDLEGQLPDHWPTLCLASLPTPPPVPNSLQMEQGRLAAWLVKRLLWEW